MEQAREHWAFRPCAKKARAAGGPFADVAWPRNPIDAFILAGLEVRGAGVRRRGPIAEGEWLRRVTFDVTGLPPSPEEIAAFASDRPARPRGVGR